MKILLISSNSSGAGGGEQYLVYLAKGLKELGEMVIVLLSTRSYMDVWEKKFEEIGVEIRRENLIGLRDRPFRVFQNIRDKKQIKLIASICEEIKPDIIYVNQQYDADGLDYVMGALAYGKASTIGTIHMPMSLTKHLRNKRAFRTRLIKILFLDAIKTSILKNWYRNYNYAKIFVSKAMQDEFITVYGRENYSCVVTHGIDTDNIPYCSDKKRGNVLGFCGRFDPQKNLFLLIEGWLNSRQKGLNSNLLLIGDGVLRKKIEKKLIKEAIAGSWEITGWIDNPQSYLSKIGLLVITSRFEGVPFAIIEASCMGKPALCVKFPGISELIEKIPFLTVVDSRNPSVLGNMIVECMKKNSPSEEEVWKVRNYFSCRRMAEDTLLVYKKIS